MIGIVTSPTGAVIRDILHRLADRFPRHVLIWPVAVQGEGAAAQVAAAIDGFNRLPDWRIVPRPDLIIVARGGGSLEDLMAFNEEIVVRAAAASAIPLISAVGHETDTTLIDHASDRRAPTPTAAAEMAVPVRLDLVADLAGKSARLAGGLARLFAERRLHLGGLARGLPDPQDLLGAAAQRLDDRSRAAAACRSARALRAARHRLDLAAVRSAAEALAADASRARPARRSSSDAVAAAMRRALAAQARRRRQFRRPARDPFRAPREPAGARLCRGARRRCAGRYRGAKVKPGAALELEFYDGKVGRHRRRPAPAGAPLGAAARSREACSSGCLGRAAAR